MKTTVEISDVLFARAREAAKARGTTLRALIEQGLHAAISQPVSQNARPELRDFSFGDAAANTQEFDLKSMRAERDFVVVDGELIKR